MTASLPKFAHIRHSFGEYVNNLSVTQDISKDAKLSPYGSVGNEFYCNAWDHLQLIELITPSIKHIAHV
jgi:hypothetical protein